MKIDLRGQRFNSLTVIEKTDQKMNDNVLWKCRCDCGTITTATTYQLRGGHKKSCGCLKHRSNAEDLIGQEFGYLTVKKRVGTTDTRKAIWRCKCKCGNLTNVTTADLKSGNTKSCGCLHKNYAQRNINKGVIR